MLRYLIASNTDKVPSALLPGIARAFEEGEFHKWFAWRQYLPAWAADAPPVAYPWDAREPMPPWEESSDVELSRTVAILFQDGRHRRDNVLAVHFVSGDRPAARVFVDASSGLNTGRESAFESASHEGELLVNPYLLNWWSGVPGREHGQVAAEICDPVQTSYNASTLDPTGRPWQLANFVHPAWAGLENPPGVSCYDHSGELSRPGQIGPEGYAVVRSDNWEISNVYGAKSLQRFAAAGGPEMRAGSRAQSLVALAAREKQAMRERLGAWDAAPWRREVPR